MLESSGAPHGRKITVHVIFVTLNRQVPACSSEGWLVFRGTLMYCQPHQQQFCDAVSPRSPQENSETVP